jgi:hypothetical protein
MVIQLAKAVGVDVHSAIEQPREVVMQLHATTKPLAVLE